MSAFPDPPRYCFERQLPEMSFVPGRSSRPTTSLSVDGDSSGNLRFAVDLFNHGHYWEAHEVWEHEWIAAGRRGPWADVLKGLIKLAAAGVKVREGNVEGARRHRLRAIELLSSARKAWQPTEQGRTAWDWDELLAFAQRLQESSSPADVDGARPCRLWGDVIHWGRGDEGVE